MVSRRSFVASSAVATALSLSGCLGLLADDTEQHYIDMYNGSERSHVFVVTVADEATEPIFEHTYELGPRTGDENRVIEGEPTTVAVSVDDAEPVQFSWVPQVNDSASAASCSEGATVSLRLHYQLAAEPEIEPTYDCETVTD